jgi:hypothetical protein
MSKYFWRIAALILLGGATAANAMQPTPPQQQAAPEHCYPGLACPGGSPIPDEPPPQQQRALGEKFYFVGTVRPPDPWLALRTEPSARSGQRIMKMPQGTLLRLIGRRGFWWRVSLTTGEEGWAHSKWIKCCKTADE